jgi:hypothetical protein
MQRMKKFEILILDEDDDYSRGYYNTYLHREIWLANYVILRRKDGTVTVEKDRFNYPNSKSVATIGIPPL